MIARPFNTYGPRQSARAVIPTIITQLLSGQTELKLGDITPTRDFNYVQDTVDGFIALLECEAVIGQTFNFFASGEDYSILDVANLLIKIINPKAKGSARPAEGPSKILRFSDCRIVKRCVL